MSAGIKALIIPGWQNSGPDHWQSAWQKRLPDAERVRQRDWDHPERNAWVDGLDRSLRTQDAPVLLIAHSLGCITVARWAAQAEESLLRNIAGALLVAPADVERVDADPALRSFAPIARSRLPFRSIVVASTNDPFCSSTRAQQMAQDWDAEFVSIGAAGHVNAAAGYTEWYEGMRLLRSLYASTASSFA